MIGLSEIKAYLRVTSAAQDSILEALERSAVAFIEEETGRYFGAPVATTEYVSGLGVRDLWLTETPTAPVVVEQETVENETVSWETVTATKYVTRGARLVHYLAWEAGVENYRVTYTKGYDAGEEPETIRRAVLDLVKYKYDGRNRSEGMQAETISGYSYTLADADHINYEAAIDDKTIYTRPWKLSTVLYRRKEKGAQLNEFKCVEFVEEMIYGYLKKK